MKKNDVFMMYGYYASTTHCFLFHIAKENVAYNCSSDNDQSRPHANVPGWPGWTDYSFHLNLLISLGMFVQRVSTETL